MSHPARISFIAAVLASCFAAVALALVNPHIKPEPCDSCHIKVPTKEEGEAGIYFLLKGNIDDTCQVCHEYSCCKVGSLHEKSRNHPSNINTWDTEKFRTPKTLPLFEGYVTCNTCHFHSKPDGPSYKLVRMVTITDKKIEWEKLCEDCHVGY